MLVLSQWDKLTLLLTSHKTVCPAACCIVHAVACYNGQFLSAILVNNVKKDNFDIFLIGESSQGQPVSSR